MMRAGASLTENRFFNNCGGKLFAKTGPILLDSNTALLEKFKKTDLSFDDLLVRKVVETVQVESAEKLEITFKDGNRRVVPISEGR